MGKMLSKLVEGGAGGSAWAKEAKKDFEVRRFSLAGLEITGGYKLPSDATLAYKVLGSGSKLWVGGTSYGITHKEMEFLADSAFDTKEYTMVFFNLLGNGVSYSPSTAKSKAEFPLGYEKGKVPTIGDNVKFQKMALDADEQLKGRQIDVVYGFSMGAMQALEWARAYPDVVKYCIPVCGSSGCNLINRLLCDTLASSLMNPLSLKVNKLSTFGLIFSGWYVGPDFYRNEEYKAIGIDTLEDFETNFAIGYWANSDPDDLLAMLQTWRFTEPFTEAQCKAIKGPKVLLLPCSTDTYFRVEDIERLEQKFIPSSKLSVIKSNWGHLAGNPEQLKSEFDFIKAELKALL